MLGLPIKANTLVGILHALATWAIVALSIWAIWWTDFGERAATLLKTEIIEERNKVNELRQKATNLQQLLTDKEIALQEYERRSDTLEERIHDYEGQLVRLEYIIEGHMQRVVNDSLKSWSAKAGGWMTGHKIRAEVASRWDEHIAWMKELREWRKGAPIPSSMPYIWNLGLIRESGRGNWSVRLLLMEDCGNGATEDENAVVGEFDGLSIAEEWLKCGEEFEREFMQSVTTIEKTGIYTVGDLIAGIEESLADKNEDDELVRRRKEGVKHVLEYHSITEAMLLRMDLQEDAKVEDIIAEGQVILGNYDKFEVALEALRKGL